MKEHFVYARSIFPSETTGVHFNLPGYTITNMTITILGKGEKNQ